MNKPTSVQRLARRRRRTFVRRWRRRLGWLALAWLLGTWLLVLILRFVPIPTSAYMLERAAAQAMRGQHAYKTHQQWVPFERIAPTVPLAMVAAEDQTFPFNSGFDVASIRSAIEEAGDGGRLRGASTITQQVARNLFLWPNGGFFRKGLEAWFTVLIDVTWPKRRVLEVYANIAELGDGIYGVEAAARSYFGVSAARLTARQAALLAAVLPSPRRWHANRPTPYLAQRANWIEQQMQQLGGVAYVLDPDPPRPRVQPPQSGRARR